MSTEPDRFHAEAEHGQPVTEPAGLLHVTTELWPVTADAAGIWLLSGDGPWPSLPVPADLDPHTMCEVELISYQVSLADVAVLYSTLWRSDTSSLILTYLAVVRVPGLVLDAWPEALRFTPGLHEVIGPAPTHGAAETAEVRFVDVLRHGIRHLRFLSDPTSIGHDATIAAALDRNWQDHLAEVEPAIARMYGRLHEPG